MKNVMEFMAKLDAKEDEVMEANLATAAAQELNESQAEQIAELMTRLSLTGKKVKTDWKFLAIDLLNKGMKQKDVAEEVGKSLASIKKLVSDNKRGERV